MSKKYVRQWGKNLLERYKIKNGWKFQLHATKGWRCVGKVENERKK